MSEMDAALDHDCRFPEAIADKTSLTRTSFKAAEEHPLRKTTRSSIELFAGCGGLAFGLFRAGFTPKLVIERDASALCTLQTNYNLDIEQMNCWRISSMDAASIPYDEFSGNIDLLSAGPPCQPFSIGGKHQGAHDERNMWPEVLRAVRTIKPKSFIFENVRGLLRPAFSQYFDYIILQLSCPDISIRPGEYWELHYERLSKHKANTSSTTYDVAIKSINAADFGSPQQRYRVVIVGTLKALGVANTLPVPTHSRAALLRDKWVTGVYWERHEIRRPSIDLASRNDRFALARLATMPGPTTLPWQTVRDGLSGLPEPEEHNEPSPGHRLRPGARIYPRHTGSGLDNPSKTVKAGVNGTPGGENVVIRADGSVRYFTIREMARLQGFPDDYVITGSWKHAIRQIGNAVPIPIGTNFGATIRKALNRN